ASAGSFDTTSAHRQNPGPAERVTLKKKIAGVGVGIAFLPITQLKTGGEMMKQLAIAVLCLAMASSTAWAQVNAGEQAPDPNLPFTVTQITTFNLPWRIAFLPDGRMLITEKVGNLWLVTPQGAKTPVANVPAVLW